VCPDRGTWPQGRGIRIVANVTPQQKRIVKRTTGLLLALMVTIGAAPAYGAAPGEAYFARGAALANAGDSHALPLLAASVSLSPGDIARQVYFLSHLDRAVSRGDVSTLAALSEIAPHYVPLLDRLGRALEHTGRTAEAESRYLLWARMRPGQVEPLARLGELYLFTDQWRKALDVFTRLRALNGESDYAMRRIGAIHQRINRPALARAPTQGREPNRAPPSDDMAMAITGNAQ